MNKNAGVFQIQFWNIIKCNTVLELLNGMNYKILQDYIVG